MEFAEPTRHATRLTGLIESRKFTLKQASNMAGVSESQMRAMAWRGDLPVLRVGACMLVLEQDLEAFLAGRYGRLGRKVSAGRAGGRAPAWVERSDLILRREA